MISLGSKEEVQDHIVSKGPVVVSLRCMKYVMLCYIDGSSLNEYEGGEYRVDELLENDDEFDFGIRYLLVNSY